MELQNRMNKHIKKRSNKNSICKYPVIARVALNPGLFVDVLFIKVDLLAKEAKVLVLVSRSAVITKRYSFTSIFKP